jgi:hypothetical protein
MEGKKQVLQRMQRTLAPRACPSCQKSIYLAWLVPDGRWWTFDADTHPDDKQLALPLRPRQHVCQPWPPGEVTTIEAVFARLTFLPLEQPATLAAVELRALVDWWHAHGMPATETQKRKKTHRLRLSGTLRAVK